MPRSVLLTRITFLSFALLILPLLSASQNCTDEIPLVTAKDSLLTLKIRFLQNESNENNQTSLHSEPENFLQGMEISSPPGKQLTIYCNHTRPVEWVYNDDYREGDIILAHTYRTIQRFTELSEEHYISTVEFVLYPELHGFIFICENIQSKCNRRIVLINYNNLTDSYGIRNLEYSEISHNSQITDFLSEREHVETFNEANNETCPMHLFLYYIQDLGFIWYTWDDADNTEGFTDHTNSAEMIQNKFRLTPKLNDHCVALTHLNYSSENKQVCLACHLFYFRTLETGYGALYFYNTAHGNSRVFKLLVDLNSHRMHYESEQLDDSYLIEILRLQDNPIKKVVQPVFYKGEQMSFIAQASTVKFSKGVIVSWGFPGEENHDEPVIVDVDDTYFNPKEGAYEAEFLLNIPKKLLDERNVSFINVTCLFPVWNTKNWMSKSIQAFLKDSAYPSTTLLDETHGLEIMNLTTLFLKHGDKLNVSCVGRGVPLPEVVILSDMGFISTQSVNASAVLNNLLLEKVDVSYEGTYRCIATNSIGESEVIFNLKLVNGLSFFELFLVITLCVAVTLFLFIGGSLALKFRNLQEEFKRKTDEVVRRFHGGFKDIQAITFASNAEYNAYELPLSNWEMGPIIGKGAFGIVRKGFIRIVDEVTCVAVKSVNAPKDVTEFEASLKELLIMAYIGRYPHIVNLIVCCTDNMSKRSLMLATEFCLNGDLLSFIKKNKTWFCKEGMSATRVYENNEESLSAPYVNIKETPNISFSLRDLNVWALHIADGMSFLESKKVLHGDLAARNVLLTEQMIAKISDFGLSRQLSDDDNYTKKTYCPLPWKWMALESLLYRQFSSKSDVWAYGVTLYEIFSMADEPWPFMNWNADFLDQLEQGRRLAMPTYATKDMYEAIMLECWRLNPDDRPSFTDIIAFFADSVA